jgi:hypothetical protein
MVAQATEAEGCMDYKYMLKLSILRHGVFDRAADGESHRELDYALEYAGAQADIVKVIAE